MKATRQKDTAAEVALTAILSTMGLSFETDRAPVAESRRRADIVFRASRVAIFVDGCFWHGCPEHGTWPKANSQFWRDKITANARRDVDTVRMLEDCGWRVFRFWEHLPAQDAALAVKHAIAGYLDPDVDSRSRESCASRGGS
jgi:DNA mismatch endonuclease (patch repair protein)